MTDDLPCVCCDDAPLARVYRGDQSWHDGIGWYYVDDEYPEEGACGAFATREEAEAHAREAGYAIAPDAIAPGRADL